MKLRQKLAVVLASAMVATSVPVVTMAASTNSLAKETIKVAKNDSFTTTSAANAVKMTFKDSQQGNTEVFYLEITNSKWLDLADGYEYTDVNRNVIKYTKQDDKIMKVEVTVNNTEKPVSLPLLTKVTGGDATVKVSAKGGATTVTDGSTFVYATSSEKKVSAKVTGDVPTFYRSGELAEISIEEAFVGAIGSEGTLTFKVELDDTDYKFNNLDNIEIKGAYGFSGQTFTYTTGTPAANQYTAVADTDGSGLTITVKLPNIQNQDSIGVIRVNNLSVKSTSKTPGTGDFLVDVKGDQLSSNLTNAVVAKVAEYGTYIEMKDEKVIDIIGGRIEEAEFTIGELVEDSIISGREFEMTLENGHFDYKGLVEEYYKSEPTKYEGASDKTYKKLAAGLPGRWLAEQIIANADDWSTATPTEVVFDVDEDGYAVIDTLVVTVGLAEGEENAQSNEEIDQIDFKLNVCVPVTNKEKEKVTITANGRALEAEVSTTLAKIVNPFDITSEAVSLKVGLQNQVGGKVVLTEKDKEMLQKGTLRLQVVDKDEEVGIYLQDVDFSTEGGIKSVDDKVTKGKEGYVTVTVNRTSKEAATLILDNFKFTTDRSVPEGTYDLKISGTALDEDGHSITIKDFIVISTANTEDITAANGLAKGTVKFEIGKTVYTALDGTEKTMDAQALIQDPGYTMIPVRYLAEAFGVASNDILFSNGTVTLFAGNRTVQLTNGSDIAIVNGAQVKMATPVVIKNNRTYAPVGEIATILGLTKDWNPTTKVATFTNK